MAKKVYYRDYMRALRALPQVPDVNIHQLSGDDDPVELGVNWAAIGTVSAERAKRFAADVIAAVDAIENFPYNGYIQDFLDPGATERDQGPELASSLVADEDKPKPAGAILVTGTYAADLMVPTDEVRCINGFLFDNRSMYQGDDISHTVRFPNGVEMVIACKAGVKHSWMWATLRSAPGEEPAWEVKTEAHHQSCLRLYELYHDGVTYQVTMFDGGDIKSPVLVIKNENEGGCEGWSLDAGGSIQ